MTPVHLSQSPAVATRVEFCTFLTFFLKAIMFTGSVVYNGSILNIIFSMFFFFFFFWGGGGGGGRGGH